MSGPVPPWFLDVDGVVNAFPPPKPGHRSAAQFEHVDVPATGPDGRPQTFEIWFRPRLVAAVNALHRARRVQVCWLTTWGPQAATRLAPAVGLDEFDVLDLDDGSPPSSPDWWKPRAIRQRVPPGGRFVFTDDSLDRASRRVLRDVYGSGALLITPMPSPGLTDGHMDRVRGFLDAA